MKIAILGKLNQTTNYQDWYTCFHHQLRKVPISEIIITGGNTRLNRYVKYYAKFKAIPVKQYHIEESADPKQAKLDRNNEIIHDAELVVACVDEQLYAEKSVVVKAPIECINRAVIV